MPGKQAVQLATADIEVVRGRPGGYGAGHEFESFALRMCGRILAATARVHGLTLLTADESLLAYPHVRTLDARI